MKCAQQIQMVEVEFQVGWNAGRELGRCFPSFFHENSGQEC